MAVGLEVEGAEGFAVQKLADLGDGEGVAVDPAPEEEGAMALTALEDLMLHGDVAITTGRTGSEVAV